VTDEVKPLGKVGGRMKGYSHIEKTRERIRATQIMNRLQKHVFGLIEMTPTQLRAAEILLKKVIPDLKQVEHTGSIQHFHVSELTDEQLAAIAAGSGAGTADETVSTEESPPVH
jgi:midasin (ATPase involved in ribosome maturation)